MQAAHKIYTIGHSNKSMDHFLALLSKYHVDVLVDVRSYPFSKYAKHFDTDCMQKSVTAAKFKYIFMGRELGGMPKDEGLYKDDGQLDYQKVAASQTFITAIERLKNGLEKYNIALVCGEENPIGCHRRRLIGPALASAGINLLHIRGDGRVENEVDLIASKEPFDSSVQLNLFSSSS